MPSPQRVGTSWRARIKHDGVEIYLGTWPTYEEAVAAENALRVELGVPTDPYERNLWRGRKAATKTRLMRS